MHHLVDIPLTPFKIIPVDDNDPFVLEALRRRKPYELCWCGSEKKYKRCHRLREQEYPIPIGQILSEQRSIFWRRRGCMHPNASSSECHGNIIDSHSIQRKGALSKIVDDSNHVCHFHPSRSSSGLELEDIGWRKASTFPGYCAKHDTEIFSILETAPFSGSHEQCVLQSFRNVCNELYRKIALIESFEYQRKVIDKGVDIDTQINMQISMRGNIEAHSKSVQELNEIWNRFESTIASNNLDAFNSKVLYFEGELSVTSASVLHVEFDFYGNKLADLWNLDIDAEILIYSVMATDSGGAIVFCWPKEHEQAASVVSSFESYPNDEKGDVFIQYCFLNTENTYFSRSWWSNLNFKERQQIKKFSESFYYNGGAFVANEPRLVDWAF